MGPYNDSRVDYPDFAHKVARRVKLKKNNFGIFMRSERNITELIKTEFDQKKYEFISTIDIDNAYAYREKGFTRSIGGYLKSISKFDFTEIKERNRVLLGIQKDPYDTYSFQLEMLKKYKFKSWKIEK